MKISEVAKWKNFTDSDGVEWDLSFLDAHEAVYVHSAEGKEDVTYRFYVSYSFHCFAKDYPEQTQEEKDLLMYHTTKASRPFCRRRYDLAKRHLKNCILSLDKMKVFHAGYGSYAVFNVVDENGNCVDYFAPFTVFREKSKMRLHVTSAYPLTTKTGGQKVGFLKIANNLLKGKALPHPKK